MGFLVVIVLLNTFSLLSETESSAWPEPSEREFTESLLEIKNKQNPLDTNTSKSSQQEQPRPHPHAGARYSNGMWGYVADVYRVKRYMLERYRHETGDTTTATGRIPPLSYMPLVNNELDETCNRVLGNGTEKRGWKILAEKVLVDAPNPEPINSTKTLRKTTSKGRILCAIYTHEGGHHRLPGIIATWAWRCDGFFAASNRTVEDPEDDGFGAIDLPHEVHNVCC